MTMPGFTAEESLCPMSQHYYAASNSPVAKRGVIAQLPRDFDPFYASGAPDWVYQWALSDGTEGDPVDPNAEECDNALTCCKDPNDDLHRTCCRAYMATCKPIFQNIP